MINKTVLTQEQADLLLEMIDSGQAWFVTSGEGLPYQEAITRQWKVEWNDWIKATSSEDEQLLVDNLSKFYED